MLKRLSMAFAYFATLTPVAMFGCQRGMDMMSGQSNAPAILGFFVVMLMSYVVIASIVFAWVKIFPTPIKPKVQEDTGTAEGNEL